MNKKEEAGVYQLENGNWAFRYIVTVEGRKKLEEEPETSLENLSKQRIPH